MAFSPDFDFANPLGYALSNASQMGPLGPANVPGIPPPVAGKRQPLPKIPNPLQPLPNVLNPPKAGRRIDSGPQLFNDTSGGTTPAAPTGPAPVVSGFENRFGYKLPANRFMTGARSLYGTDVMDQIIANLGAMMGGQHGRRGI